MPRRLPPYCVEDVDRHGNVRIYLRRRGMPKLRLPGPAWSPAFLAAYNAAMGAEPAEPRPTVSRSKPGTWRALCEGYFASADFRRLADLTRKNRRAVLESTYDEPINPESNLTFADMPIGRLDARAVRVLRDRKEKTPEAANNRLIAIRQVFAYAMEEEVGGITTNPAAAVRRFRTVSEGFHTWTVDEVRAFMARHPIGTRAHLAISLLLYTGVRRSDVVLLGRQHVRAGWIHYTQHKNRDRRPVTLDIPILPELQAAIDASAPNRPAPKAGVAEALTFLVTEWGKPFTSNGFGNRMKDWCVEAGLPHCSSHGLRKAGATIAAENGATDRQLMAIFGWTSSRQATNYTRKADQRRLAGDAMHLISIGEDDET